MCEPRIFGVETPDSPCHVINPLRVYHRELASANRRTPGGTFVIYAAVVPIDFCSSSYSCVIVGDTKCSIV